MKTLIKVVLAIVILIIVLAGGGIAYVKTALPNVGPAPDITVEATPERLERGEYLANNVAGCIDCHSIRDFNKFLGPLADDVKKGAGGEKFLREWGFPGNFYSKNITPTGIGDWTDGELFRAITTGVSKDGTALFPLMPYPNLGKMTNEDIYSIIAYIRTLEPLEMTIPEREIDFPVSLLINLEPRPAEHAKEIPPKSDKVAYGEYMFTAASCNDCHTQMDKGKQVLDLKLAGGFRFPIPSGIVYSANITPDKETGIGNWTEEVFVQRFKLYADSSFTYNAQEVKKGDFNSLMPWLMYSHMEEEDVRAIFAYLRTVEPIKNQVTKFIPYE